MDTDGEKPFIHPQAMVEPGANIGDEVTIKCGVYLGDGVERHDRVFVGPNVTFTNDEYPRSRQYPEHYARTVVCPDASIGAHATILPDLRILRPVRGVG